MDKTELYDLVMAQYEIDLESAGYSSKDISGTLFDYTEKDKEMVLNTLYPWVEHELGATNQ